MTDNKVKDQEVKEQEGFNEADGYPSCEGTPCANMADDEQQATATMAEDANEQSAEEQNTQEPTPEEIIAVWRDKYM
ncbi:MAG: nucleotide exchange factor GrpE, partial [Alistipes sp.]|nr:nucleotide exchange factor GrpE [Alistipes sp.]